MNSHRCRRALAKIALSAAVTLTPCLAASFPTAALANSAGSTATRDQGAEQFIQAQGQRLVSMLADKSQSPDERISVFRIAVNEIADVPGITKFVLGKYARTITPAQMDRFATVFQDYTVKVYQQRLADFHGDSLTVTDSLTLRSGDVVVKTTITGGNTGQPTEVSWRVEGSGSNWKVADVETAGIWMVIMQQDEFVRTLDDNGGNIDALTSQLENLAQAQPAAAAGQ